MGQSRHDRAMKRTSTVMNLQALGGIFLILWATLFSLGVLMQLMWEQSHIWEVSFGRILLFSAPAAAVTETVIMAAAAKTNPAREFSRLCKTFGCDSDELYEYTLGVYERYRRSLNRKPMAAEWALKLTAVCLDRGRAGEALGYIRSADMTDYFKSPGFPGNMIYIISYFQLLILIDIERNDAVSEEQHYAAGEEYFREIKKENGFYPNVTVTRCQHMIFRGETAAALELLDELEEYLEGSSNTDLSAALCCLRGEAYLKQADGRAGEQFDKALELCSPWERGAMRRQIERITGNEKYGVM